MSSSDGWELSKENIQPLKCGRKAAVIITPMQEATGTGNTAMDRQRELKETRSAFEAEIRSSSSSSDPLSPWHRYISWVEQNFPRGGKEGGINVLLEKCIKEFKDDERFKQDQRYLQVWTKYVRNNLQTY